MPRVSVIIPAYNAAATITRTIDSVRRQTLDDLEIIVVDDGSTDDTARRVQAIGDARIRLRSYPHGGLPAARNRGIAEAAGEFLGFLDADDLWAKSKLASHVALLDRCRDVGVVYSWTCTIDGDDRVLGRQVNASWSGDVYRRMLEAFFIGNASNAIVRRAVIDSAGGFDEHLERGEDWDFFVRAAARWPFDVVAQYLVFYRWRAGSISSDAGRMRDGLLIAIDHMFGAAPRELQDLKPRTLANMHAYIARTYLTRCTDRTAVEQAGRSLRAALRLQPAMLLDPIVLRLLARWFMSRLLSPQHATDLAKLYHRAWPESLAAVDPWA